MGATVSPSSAVSHHERVKTAVADKLEDLEKDKKRMLWLLDAVDCDRAIRRSCLTYKQAAARLGMFPAQLSAQLRGLERPQTELFRNDPVLSGPYIEALAIRHAEQCEVRTVISVRIPVWEGR